MSQVTIVLADDHPVMRTGTRNILHSSMGLKVVGEASDGLQALDLCRELHPDLLLLDLRLPKMEGLMVVHTLKGMNQAPRILMFSAFSDDVLLRAALDAGAHGYVLKSTPGADLLNAIQRVMRGQRVLIGVDKPQTSTYPPLSVQELATLSLVSEGLSTREIALRMNNSTRTIETYLNRIFQKLGARNRTQAVTIARREQLLSPERARVTLVS